MYSLKYSKKVEKELASLPKIAYKKIIDSILKPGENPLLKNCNKLKSQIDYYLTRVGDYRII